MINPVKYLCLVLITFANISDSMGQKYSLKVTQSNFSINSVNYKGYETTFVQSHEEVKKEWWRYVKARATIFNEKSHYTLTIPADKKNGTVALKFVSQLLENEKTKKSTLKIALNPDTDGAKNLENTKKQLAHILHDFKLEYFTRSIQKEIDEEEFSAKTCSIRMDNYYLKNSKLSTAKLKKNADPASYQKQRETNDLKIAQLSVELQSIEKRLSKLKKEFTLIK